MIAVRGLDWRPPILPFGHTPFKEYILGGADGKAFLVKSFGLTQPKAFRGVVVYNEGNVSEVTIHYKTSGVTDRQIQVEFDRVTRQGLVVRC